MKQQKICSIDGCYATAIRGTLCAMHARRKADYGSPHLNIHLSPDKNLISPLMKKNFLSAGWTYSTIKGPHFTIPKAKLRVWPDEPYHYKVITKHGSTVVGVHRLGAYLQERFKKGW